MAGAAALLYGCSRSRPRALADPPATPLRETGPPPAGATQLLEWRFGDGGERDERAILVVPAWGPRQSPLVVALHGRGEAVKPPYEGAMGWPRDYKLVSAMGRLCTPPITAEDLEGFVDEGRLAALNRELLARPFQGLVVACPSVPDLDLESEQALDAYGAFLTGQLLPRARAEAAVYDSAAATGIDGVSLGGAVALHVGLAHPELFAAVGAIQPALHERDVSAWTDRAREARHRNPALKLRLLTSLDDPYRRIIERTSDAWRSGGVDHELVVLPGPHDYAFNRGPGSFELLSWHDRVLARG